MDMTETAKGGDKMTKKDPVGRPRKYEAAKVVSINCPIDLLHWARKEAREQDMGLSEFVVSVLTKTKGESK